jgi:hypothetical protein
MVLTELRFIRGPHKEPRPTAITVDFTFSAGKGCDWSPDLYHE